MLKRNLSAIVRIGKRTRAIRIQRNARVWLASRELHRRREAFKIRYPLLKLDILGGNGSRLGLANGKKGERSELLTGKRVTERWVVLGLI